MLILANAVLVINIDARETISAIRNIRFLAPVTISIPPQHTIYTQSMQTHRNKLVTDPSLRRINKNSRSI